MRIALTGASGFIGSFIAKEAAARGHSVTALVRESSRRDHIERFVDRFVVGDQADEDAWGPLLEGADAVVHNSVDWRSVTGLGGLPEPGVFAAHLERNLVSALKFLRISAPLPFVFMSSIAVHHDMRPRWEGIVDEDHPLRPSGVYGALKAAVEAHLWAEHFGSGGGRHVASIRPSGVYGVDPILDRSHGYRVIESIVRGEPFARPGGGKFVHVEDVAAATVAAAERPEVSGMAFNLADCYARHADWAQMACGVLGRRVAIDFSSAERPGNEFSKEQTQRMLGVEMSRGHEGIEAHLRELAGLMGAA